MLLSMIYQWLSKSNLQTDADLWLRGSELVVGLFGVPTWPSELATDQPSFHIMRFSALYLLFTIDFIKLSKTYNSVNCESQFVTYELGLSGLRMKPQLYQRVKMQFPFSITSSKVHASLLHSSLSPLFEAIDMNSFKLLNEPFSWMPDRPACILINGYQLWSGTHCLERVSVHANIGNWHTEIDVYTNLYNAFGLVLGGVHQSIYVYPER